MGLVKKFHSCINLEHHIKSAFDLFFVQMLKKNTQISCTVIAKLIGAFVFATK